MTPDDLPAVEAIATKVHPTLPEDAAVFQERVALYPRGCLVLRAATGLEGYLVSHPWRAADPPPLNHLLRALPALPSSYYLHDIALLPEARGNGAASRAVALLCDHAHHTGLAEISLVAVRDSVGFWRAQGFADATRPAHAEKLAGYGPGACFMIRPTAREER